MGNRSKYLVVTAATAIGLGAARRRARLRRAFEGVADTVSLAEAAVRPDEDEGGDDAHAPGHRHLPAADIGRPGRSVFSRLPWTRQAYKTREPYWPR